MAGLHAREGIDLEQALAGRCLGQAALQAMLAAFGGKRPGSIGRGVRPPKTHTLLTADRLGHNPPMLRASRAVQA